MRIPSGVMNSRFRATRIVDNPVITGQLDPLDLRRDVASLCVLYRVNYEECSKELFNVIPAADFHHRSVRRKYQQHHLDAWRSTTVRFMRNFLSHAVGFWNDLPNIAEHEKSLFMDVVSAFVTTAFTKPQIALGNCGGLKVKREGYVSQWVMKFRYRDRA
ncbi:hypothetical protein EVAR_103294_1 [Eumeta japonica]|uniref:Uncharacterized protein n=1 Tax=Eumeta variegata TaxID=151549 RepID=A0A4C1XR06_EUMVA|nr:hypothetical protein EVAR_103294_1 [Eumeta japonica]